MESARQKIVIKKVINIDRRNGVQTVRFAWFQPKGPYQRKFICTHSWTERDRSSGKRTSHILNTTGCPFQLLVQLVQRHDGSWSMMKHELYCHNHPLTEDIYRSYPGIRQVPTDSLPILGIELLV
ncbi:hypothetical protein PI124_g9739 [Phytophthora idaei]|nr:hypothetical protein PI125_g9498 [Phytophthora idaei]KAG3245520.1 hypothetical protein PI124_g9739 [Phytophthora idaei]